MSHAKFKLNADAAPQPLAPAALGSLTVQPLTDEAETLSFLTGDSIPSAFMTTLIRDNGLTSPLNRGTFYGCRDSAGQLEGVAIVGHATLFEARTEAALRSLAVLAQNDPAAHVVMGERQTVDVVMNHYAATGQSPRLICRELLFEQRRLVEAHEAVPGLRQATVDDLELVVRVHAAMAFEESGVNPLERDPEGFRQRTARRLERGRVWAWIEGGRLIFKADMVAETPGVAYLEGIYVCPEERGKGYGLRCMSQLGRSLLRRTESVCLLVNEQNHQSREFFRRADYKLCAHYDTIYLR